MKNFVFATLLILLFLAQSAFAQKTVKLNYKNKSSAIEIPINLEDDFYLELKGTPFNSEKYSRENMVIEMRQVMRDFKKAQDAFFAADYSAALISVNRSLATLETAEALALKGTIFFFLDELPRAQSFWEKAFRLDPEIQVPNAEDAEKLIEEMRKNRAQELDEELKTSTQQGSNLPPRGNRNN